MRAFALTAADRPAGLVDLPDPETATDGVRIRVRAASVNGFDVYQANGYLLAMMEHIFPTIVGRDFSGVVEAVGSGSTGFAVGDAVLGFVPATPPLRNGTYAELLGGSPVVLAPKPAGIDWAMAASIPLAGATGLDAVDAVDVGPGDTLLVVGATGGVGSFAVQLATQRGATVIATAKAGDDAVFVRSLGAAETIDYTTTSVADAVRERFPDGITAVIDTVDRDDAFETVAALVHDGGRIATTLGAADVEALAARDVAATNVAGLPTSEKLTSLAEQVSAGTLRVEIQETFPLADAPAAFAAFSAGTRGKIALIVG